MILDYFKSLHKVDKLFLVMLCLGIILRIISTIMVPLAPDAYTYLAAAKGITNLNYTSFRPPGFPFFISIFLLITGNDTISTNLASLTFGILLMISAYYVFTKASEAILIKNKTNMEDFTTNVKYIGLLSSFFISLSLYLIHNNGRGLREELMAFTSIMIFYYMIIKKKLDFKDTIGLILSISILTLSHFSAGLFYVGGILIFYIISFVKYFNYENVEFKRIIIIILSFIISFSGWALFSFYKFGDPLYNWTKQSTGFNAYYDINLSSLEGLVDAILSGLFIGLPYEFLWFSSILGFIFTLIMIYFLVKNIRNKQISFIFITVGLSYLYLSIFMSIPGDPRLMIYFFPFLFYLVSIPIASTLYNSRTKSKLHYKIGNSKITLKQISIIILYCLTYTFRTMTSLFDSLISIVSILNVIFIMINEICLILLIIGNSDTFFSSISIDDQSIKKILEDE